MIYFCSRERFVVITGKRQGERSLRFTLTIPRYSQILPRYSKMEKATIPLGEADFKMSEMIPGALNFLLLLLSLSPCSLFPRHRPRSTAAAERPSASCFCLWPSLLVSLMQTLPRRRKGPRRRFLKATRASCVETGILPKQISPRKY